MPEAMKDKVRGERHWSRHLPERVARGEWSGTAKLTEAAVLEMRTLYHQHGWTYKMLAKRFNVGRITAYWAVRGVTWKHIGGEVQA
jgi:hypothetical protein